jgi:hypothetical protein
LNDFGSIILVYQGSEQAIGELVYRLELPEPITVAAITSIYDKTDLSTHTSISHPVILAHEAAGFEFVDQRIRFDNNGAEYAAILVRLGALFSALTFEQLHNDEYVWC